MTAPDRQPANGSSAEALQLLRALVTTDLQDADQLILKQLHSDVALVNQLGAYIINSGGKRMRPLLVLLAARACGYEGGQHVDCAAIIEFIHTATLLHDDVVDGSDMRRGEETANSVWGNDASVLVGDFLYSRAFQMMVGVGSMEVMEIMADTTNLIAEGEVMQLLNCHDPDITEEKYLKVIYAKTGKLFEAGARLGAVLAGRPKQEQEALASYGAHLGTAFQMVDDHLDYGPSSDEIGKNIGDDLAEGKTTLPLIYALRHGTPEQVAILRHAIEKGRREDFDLVSKAIESTGAIAYTARRAADEAAAAAQSLVDLPDSPYKEALIQLAEFSVRRNH